MTGAPTALVSVGNELSAAAGSPSHGVLQVLTGQGIQSSDAGPKRADSTSIRPGRQGGLCTPPDDARNILTGMSAHSTHISVLSLPSTTFGEKSSRRSIRLPICTASQTATRCAIPGGC